jgi:hypothetical protein
VVAAVWANGASGGTPITALELNRIEAAITANADAATALGARVAIAEAELAVTPALVKAPIVPPAAQYASASAANAVWFTLNRGIVQRFAVDAEYRINHAVIPAAVASGTVEVSIFTCVRTSATAFNLARVGTSGIVTCPAVGGTIAGAIVVNFSSPPIILAPGSYAVSLWFSNVTASVTHATSSTPLQPLQLSLTDGGGGASGVPTPITGATTTNRYVAIALESAL